MPNWVTHLGTAYVGARMARVREVRLVLLGAILPDVTVPAFVVVDWLHLPPRSAFTYLVPFQSLTVVSLLAAAIALLHRHPGRCFLLVWGGALSHFALDVLETDFDCGMRVFYPFSFRAWSPGWLAPGGTLSLGLLTVSALALIVALRQRTHLTTAGFRLRNLRFALPLVALAVALPLFTRGTLVAQNVHFLAFLTDPAAWQGQSVELCFSEVISTSPLTVEEFGRRFEVVTKQGLNLGERISMRGVYRDGKIYPTRLYVHRGFSEAWLSLAGLAVLLVIWLRSGQLFTANVD